MAPVRAMGVTPWILGVAEVATKPGDVDAPIGIPALLSPGNKAAEKIFERDARSGRKR
ncbi:hypothetical protein COCSUDRAFT_58442 [Coccomyxa subellipsoidea C-169]|uniref:Uncharacterized protein n=1 Tax=Coccomyxa subellipsoidea (strain C-169) TaxID=574566 RepID=I0YMU1_COCSC|nr:hypothetical protein COCSUDRAFT_58442 [Coccomyxa subellipsoidea C-169]EIE19710.1 hypothetical protein COCSUDRAFT_58442 [Coccomyxa subellipsoidea C-169]|eukprot:XP_005644254.1 hypothetical protein COCSUDRAFT_58442 [Coccomyxa subellipsoidea C-169]